MALFRNKSNKVIGVGGIYVRPDEEVELADEMVNLPSLQAIIGLGLAEIVDTQAHEKEIEAKALELLAKREAEAKAAAEKIDAPVGEDGSGADHSNGPKMTNPESDAPAEEQKPKRTRKTKTEE